MTQLVCDSRLPNPGLMMLQSQRMDAYFDEIRDHPEPTGRWIPGDLELLFLAGDEWQIFDRTRRRLQTATGEVPATEQQELVSQTQDGVRELNRRRCHPNRDMSQATGRGRQQDRAVGGEGTEDDDTHARPEGRDDVPRSRREQFGVGGSWEFR
jgi:hypothetical protein